jgi:putative SOS response-associated peptidase YedK
MCFFSKLTQSAAELKKRFQADFAPDEKYVPAEEINGFSYPKTPVIANNDPSKIQMFNWGLLPSWAEESFRKNTLNARLESIHDKPSFRPYLQNRCLVLADGFYEWQWLDSQGKKKQKYLVTIEGEDAFAFAGLWNRWTNKETGVILNTYTIITRPANALMSEIHNSKLRMPFILSRNNEHDWLGGKEVEYEEVALVAKALPSKKDTPHILFD